MNPSMESSLMNCSTPIHSTPIRKTLRASLVLSLALSATLLAGCGGGGGGGYYVPVGDVEVDNQTDLFGPAMTLYDFRMRPAGAVFFSGNVMPGVAFPGETVFVGGWEEDYYEAEATFDDGFGGLIVPLDGYVYGGAINTFEAY